MGFECKSCNENCHVSKLPWWGNECMIGRVKGECFNEYVNTFEVI